MTSMVNGSMRFVWLLRATVLLCAAMLGLAVGCSISSLPLDGDNGNDNTAPDGTSGVSGEIISFSSNIGVSELDPPISVIYSVTGTPDSISGFYVPVSGAGSGAGPIGDRQIVAANLSPGANRFFNFDAAEAGVGFFRVGIIMTVGGAETIAQSQGVVQVQGRPEPSFIRPSQPITEVVQGADVAITFDAGDPEGDVQWRLFYLTETDSRDNPPDLLGTQIGTVGSGNVGGATLSTATLDPGDYELGVSATDSGLSIANTVANGDLERIVTIPNPATRGPIIRVIADIDVVAPTLTFTAPGAGDVYLFRDEAFTLMFATTISEPGATGLVELFYDDDSNFGNGFRATISDTIPASATSYPLPTSLPEGTWHIGGTVRTVGGVSPSVTVYATAKVVVVREPTLVVTKPDSSLPVSPGTGTLVAWTTTMPGQSADVVKYGSVDVFVRTVDSGGLPFGAEIPVVTGGAVATTSATFTGNTPGLYQVTVRLEFKDAAIKTGNAPRNLRVSSLPRVLWIGSLTETDPPFEGAIFGGVNYQDNAGTSLSPAGDLDADGLDDFVIGARYGKPFFVNPSGIGPGEAYVVYGAQAVEKLLGEYNLNSVGTSALRGITLTGIPTVGNSSDTDGLSDITLIPDADGDKLGELIFGFPRTNSDGGTVGPLEADGQFLNGGVVILSSDNNMLKEPPSVGAAIDLVEVGQRFSNMTPIRGTAANPVGFTPVLAPPGIPPEGGSGFYPSTTTALEPKGARIIGLSQGDRFGTSVTYSNSLGGTGPGDLIISAPNRTGYASEIEGISGDIAEAGVAFLMDNRNLCGADVGLRPPCPCQYVIDAESHFGDNRDLWLDALRIMGDTGDKIENMIGIDDFNGDGRNDFAVGAPNAGGGQGRVYIAYRREEALEGDFVLGKLKRDPTDAERLDGMLIVTTTLDALGSSLATGFDFNNDGISDLAIGSPNASGGVGEVVIVFGNPGISSGTDGITVSNLLSTRRTSDGAAVAARIKGNALDVRGGFGFNIANAGDVDGDGFDDLLVAAPNASPRYDPDPNDGTDTLSQAGLDLDFNGLKDDVSGPQSRPDGKLDSNDDLLNAGVVYVIFGSNRLDRIPAEDITVSIDQLGGANLRGLMIVGRTAGDRIGGGDAGDADAGGISGKLGRGRSKGLAPAGDVDGDGRADILVGAVLADPRRDPNTGAGVQNGGEAYIIYGSVSP